MQMQPVRSTRAYTAGFVRHVRRRSESGYNPGQRSVKNPLYGRQRFRDQVRDVNRRGPLFIGLPGSHRRGIWIFGHTLMVLLLR